MRASGRCPGFFVVPKQHPQPRYVKREPLASAYPGGGSNQARGSGGAALVEERATMTKWMKWRHTFSHGTSSWDWLEIYVDEDYVDEDDHIRNILSETSTGWKPTSRNASKTTPPWESESFGSRNWLND